MKTIVVFIFAFLIHSVSFSQIDDYRDSQQSIQTLKLKNNKQNNNLQQNIKNLSIMMLVAGYSTKSKKQQYRDLIYKPSKRLVA